MKAVIDTNVLLVANGRHPGASPDCVSECVRRLEKMRSSGVTVIDDDYRIIKEYLRKIRPNGGKRVGDVFLKSLLQQLSTLHRVEKVSITAMTDDCFAEFPNAELQSAFDRSDRMFVAVANAHSQKPPVWQAADCKWLDWWTPLADTGIRVEFLCPEDVCKFYRRKFPANPEPLLPPR